MLQNVKLLKDLTTNETKPSEEFYIYFATKLMKTGKFELISKCFMVVRYFLGL